jgi:hypothetical protein
MLGSLELLVDTMGWDRVIYLDAEPSAGPSRIGWSTSGAMAGATLAGLFLVYVVAADMEKSTRVLRKS